MQTKKTVLIIKLGYCETLAHEKGFVPSLGDVFRHTVLLHHYRDYHVTWLASESVYTLLAGNPLISELLIYKPRRTAAALRNRAFDEVLCLEKAPVLCNLSKRVQAKRRLGFGWDGREVHAHPMSEEALKIANGHHNPACIQDLLFNMVGACWQGEDYVTGYQPRSAVEFDVGLNYLVGSKWPSKAWPMEHWRALERLCRARGRLVTWQEGAGDLYTYMDWINSARLIVTCDSLGMHLGLAYRKNVVALFGPTPSSQIHLYDRGVLLRAASDCGRQPCMLDHCRHTRTCMEGIQPEAVMCALDRLLGPPRRAVRTPILAEALS